jgi:hypothetical protein
VLRHVGGDPDARNTESTLTIDCLDGASGRIVMQPDDEAGQLPSPLLFTVATECRIALTRPGVVPGGYVSSEISIDGTSASAVLPTTVEVPLTKASVMVSLTDVYFATAAGPSAPIIDTSTLPFKTVAMIAGGLATIAALTLIGLIVAARRSSRRAGRRVDPRTFR